MKTRMRLALFIGAVFLALLPAARAQLTGPRIHSILIRHVGPPAVSDDFIRANIRSKAGETFSRAVVDEDIKSLYTTGYFFKIQAGEETTADGIDLTFVVQGKPILTDIKIVGNKKMSLKKLKKKITSKTGQPLDERKIFDDAQAMRELYEKSGYQKTTVTAEPPVIDEAAGRGTVTFMIHETPRIRIRDIVFVNATLPQKQLRKVLKTRRHWMFSWLTGSGVLKDDDFDDDQDKLVEYFQNKGYIDFAIKDIQYDHPTPKWMIIRIIVSEGKLYKVGTLDIRGNHVYSTNEFINGVKMDRKLMKLKLTPGATFTPADFNDDVDTIRDLYGAKGYLEQNQGGSTVFSANHIANPSTGKIDVSYGIEEGEKCYIEKIIIKGNVKTKDKVLRRELAVYPGEVYDMVRVKISKSKLEQMQYFEKVDTEAQETDVPNRKDLVIGVEEKNTGNVSVGAGFSSVESIVGFVELKQGNFDLFNPPTFTGAGQKFEMKASIGTLLQDYEVSFVEPWFLGKQLALGVDLFHREVDYNSLNNMYDESFDGATLSLTKALGFPGLKGGVNYTIEDAHVAIVPGFTTNFSTNYTSTVNGLGHTGTLEGGNISTNILDSRGTFIISQVGVSLTYDTRNNFQLPDKGQMTEVLASVAAPPGDTEFYKLELRTSWFFPGFAPGHILELDGHLGVVSTWDGTTQVPIFERWFLGGLYNLRGYKYQTVGPMDPYGEPLGGDTVFFGSAEYSIPIIKMLRVAAFYDIGNVFPDPFSFNPGPNRELYSDDAGLGLRIILPIGGGTPLRLDYGVPITHDSTVGSSGRFQFGFGFTHPF
ncbi:MAG TPA: outer membrane protein assembly factor BamA [Candidatus Baltobacteraceae bacterium]|jgi:outer membrane protein insertion porin family|nr:outer membrane protein assembly factor BamA [Candidatus Baltobacteraceae bacterium]